MGLIGGISNAKAPAAEALFAGKRILILGPAASAQAEFERIDPDAFDFIVRMNKAIDVPLERDGAPYPFHNVYVRSQVTNKEGSLAGEITAEKIARNGTEIIIFPVYRIGYFTRFFRKALQARRRGVAARILFVPPSFVRAVARQLGGARPTTGFVTLSYFLGLDFERLHVAGFTFFTTAYLPGYNDAVTDRASAKAWVARTPKHNAEAELALFRETVTDKRARGAEISLGQDVDAVLYGPADETGSSKS